MSERLSKFTTCGYCSNKSKMTILGSVSDKQKEESDNEYGPPPEQGTIYNILKCPACEKNNIISYYWHDFMEDEDDITYELLYPTNRNIPLGLPEKVLKAFNASERVKNIDINAYAILLRRLLEVICIDRTAKEGTLASMLADLASKGEIPAKLVDVAKGLKDLGNIGAHATIGELTEKEIPILAALTNAILDYVYSAPYLADVVEKKLLRLKGKI